MLKKKALQLLQRQNLRRFKSVMNMYILKLWTQTPYLGKSCFTTDNVLLNGIERAAKLEIIQIT